LYSRQLHSLKSLSRDTFTPFATIQAFRIIPAPGSRRSLIPRVHAKPGSHNQNPIVVSKIEDPQPDCLGPGSSLFKQLPFLIILSVHIIYLWNTAVRLFSILFLQAMPHLSSHSLFGNSRHQAIVTTSKIYQQLAHTLPEITHYTFARE